MISKERLEELIGQSATIYEVKYNNINPVSLTNKIRDVYYKNGVIAFEPRPDEKYLHHKYFKNLFETKEEAEWHRQFGCIERTERLELPTWEEFSKWDKSIKFYNNSIKYSMYVFVKNKNTKNCRIIIYADNGEQDWLVFEQPLTQENYTVACRKCVELFLGEKK